MTYDPGWDELRTALDELDRRPGPGLVIHRGDAPWSLLPGDRTTHLPCSEESGAAHRDRLGRRLGAWPEGLEAPPTWAMLLEAVVGAGPNPGPARWLVLSEAHRLLRGQEEELEGLARGFEAIRRTSRPLILLLAGERGPELAGLGAEGSRLAPWVDLETEVPPVTLRGMAARFPRWTPEDLLAAWGLTAGERGALRLLQPHRTLRRNVHRLLLDPGGPWFAEMDGLLRRPGLTHPARYGDLLAAVARGARSWGEIREVMARLGERRPGPYLARLREMGLIQTLESLDAQPGQRSRRYRVARPLVEAWYRWCLDRKPDLRRGAWRDFWREVLRPALLRRGLAGLPQILDDLLRVQGEEILGARTRESGGLWGRGYDLPLAGILGNGSAFYVAAPGVPQAGTLATLASAPGAGPDLLRRLDRQIGETRYGFGRERRLRVLLSPGIPDPALQREVARRPDTVLLGPEALFVPGTEVR